MLYAAFIFWLLVVVFAAYGIYQLWSGMVKPKLINMALLPGTLVAQLGRILGLLITGGTLDQVKLFKNEEEQDAPGREVETRVPVMGPILTALLPMLACGFSIYMVVGTIGQDVMMMLGAHSVSETLPVSFGSFWGLLRGSITLVEDVTTAILSSDLNQWQTWLFLYLIVCLTVRLAPFPGMQRGAIGAIVFLGLVAVVAGLAIPATVEVEASILNLWNMLSLSVATLLFLLIVSLMVRGGVGLFRILANKQ